MCTYLQTKEYYKPYVKQGYIEVCKFAGYYQNFAGFAVTAAAGSAGHECFLPDVCMWNGCPALHTPCLSGRCSRPFCCLLFGCKPQGFSGFILNPVLSVRAWPKQASCPSSQASSVALGPAQRGLRRQKSWMFSVVTAFA